MGTEKNGIAILPVLLMTMLIGCSESSETSKDGTKKPNVAYVTNGVASFWTIAKAGALAGGKDFDANVDVLMPVDGIGDQKRMIENLLTQGIDGIAISPIDSPNQTKQINEACEATHLITQDCDAPDTNRLCYIGMDNYQAGRLAGQLVKEALPEGGEVIIFAGRFQSNAILRRQGVIDELLDRSNDNTRYDEPGKPLKGDKYTVVDTRTDDFDFAKAKANAEDAITAVPKLQAMVGLLAYNPPACLKAIKEANKIGQIRVIAFDEDDVTLAAIKDGSCYGTVVQNPYKYGYESVRVLTGLARGDKSVLPADGFLDIPAQQIRQDTVEAFEAELKKNLAAGK